MSASSVEVVHRWVLDGMLRGDLPPGTWLRQDDLAVQLGVSTIPVREALHRLAAGGLLTFERNRGVRVPVLTVHDAEEIFALRRGLEPALLTAAIARMTIVHLAEAEFALAPDDRHPAATPTEANWAFHRALYAAAGWDRGLAIVEVLFAAVAPYVLLYTHGLHAGPESHAQHHALLQACRDEDADTAGEVLRSHLADADAALQRFLRRPAGQPPNPTDG